MIWNSTCLLIIPDLWQDQTAGKSTESLRQNLVAQVAMKDISVYAASKGAIAQLTKVIAVEYGAQGIRANAVAPGVVETDILEDIVSDSRATLAGYGSAHPIGRVGQPQEIAEIIAFLASPASAFITGSIVMADGGFTAL